MSKKTILIAMLTLTMAAAVAGLAHARGGMMGYGWGPDRDDYRGGYGCDGPRFERSGYGPGNCYLGSRQDDSSEGRSRVDITREEAEDLVSFRLRRTNDNLKVGKVTENEDGFQVEVVTKKGGELVDRLQVKKDTGRIYRLFE